MVGTPKAAFSPCRPCPSPCSGLLQLQGMREQRRMAPSGVRLFPPVVLSLNPTREPSDARPPASASALPAARDAAHHPPDASSCRTTGNPNSVRPKPSPRSRPHLSHDLLGHLVSALAIAPVLRPAGGWTSGNRDSSLCPCRSAQLRVLLASRRRQAPESLAVFPLLQKALWPRAASPEL